MTAASKLSINGWNFRLSRPTPAITWPQRVESEGSKGRSESAVAGQVHGRVSCSSLALGALVHLEAGHRR
jgi:hypothetical protein